jgi:hypothetical protein
VAIGDVPSGDCGKATAEPPRLICGTSTGAGDAAPYSAPSSDVISATLAFASPKSIWVFSL